MPRRRRLTDAGIARLRPEAREYTVWDMNIAGLGVRVRPSGSRTFIYHRKTPGGMTKMSLGPAGLRKVEDVRRDCLETAAGAVEACDAASDAGRSARPLFRDFTAGPWKAACFDHGKPSTQKGLRSALKSQLLPAFGTCRLDRITRSMVLRWFEGYSRTAPGGANKALDLLRGILYHAIVCGHIETNPTRGIKRNPGRKLTRFLSREEIARLHRVLDRYAEGSRSQAQQTDIIRLLLLTGCRKGEIVRLRRDEVRGDRLQLRDSKTGPRTIILNAEAQEILDRRMQETDSPWVFPSASDSSRPRARHASLWYAIRREAGIEDVRLHDLRHTVASQAVLNGVPLIVAARLLGHRNMRMTMRYAHVGDREIEAAAERVGQVIAELLTAGRFNGRTHGYAKRGHGPSQLE
ncbi:MAG: tyrosine-type recombinase/integrase [Alphaproteobacteria bacterium]|nr:tyrosine-type recombinase/integrase [Alphaproteobacteria bacterium]